MARSRSHVTRWIAALAHTLCSSAQPAANHASRATGNRYRGSHLERLKPNFGVGRLQRIGVSDRHNADPRFLN